MSDIQATDECYRCSYDLRGIADAQPCPECGLLAERSRRATDELHLTRPTWLRRLSIGVWVILVGLVVGPVVTYFILNQPIYLYDYNLTDSVQSYLEQLILLAGALLSSIALAVGAWLVATPEGHANADHADRRRRWAIRILPLILILGIFWYAYMSAGGYSRIWYPWTVFYSNPFMHPALSAILILISPLPVLFFAQLRSLAVRARSSHLAEHCTIVGIGTSLSFIYVAIAICIRSYAVELGLGEYWMERSPTLLILLTLIGVTAAVTILWSIYLMARFAFAFRRASVELHKTWNRDDKSLQPD